MQRRRVAVIRQASIWLGTAILAPSLSYLALGMLGVLPTEVFAIGASSGLKTIASAAIFGCLLAAVGSWDE